MKIAMIGTGYVGLVSGASFASFGNHVTCVDKDASKIAALLCGEIPIFGIVIFQRRAAGDLRAERIDNGPARDRARIHPCFTAARVGVVDHPGRAADMVPQHKHMMPTYRHPPRRRPRLIVNPPVSA